MTDFDVLRTRLASRSARVGVIGMGYVGLPIALSVVNAGFEICGFDTDPSKPEALKRGESYISYIPDRAVAEANATGRFSATSNYDELEDTDVMLVCVPTPLTRHREPDMRFIESSCHQIARRLRPGQMIILESTTYPGTTEELVRPILEGSGLKSGKDFLLAFSPEREDPGNKEHGLGEIPKVVGADDETARKLATQFYEQFVPGTVQVSNSRTAETVKLVENIFRAVNIALANELKVVCDSMSVDIWEVIEAAKTKPFGFMPFYPGPGLGGHCIPIDPFYLTWKAREYDLHTRFIELAGEVNAAMPRYVVEKLMAALSDRFGIGLRGTPVLVVGVAYKGNVDDTRGSASFKIISLLEERGAEVSYFDRLVPVLTPLRDYPDFVGRESIAWSAQTLRAFKAALILTDHDGTDYETLLREVPLVVDTRNATASLGQLAADVVKA